MSTTVSFPSVRNQGLSVEEKAKLQKVMLASLVTLQQGRRLRYLVSASSTSSNVEPAQNTTKNFAPNLR
jgi:hypothetical protein